MLEVNNLHVQYGVVPALRGLSLCVAAGEVVTVIGANGAGKTTLLRAILGLQSPTVGDIRYDGKSIRRRLPEELVRLGLVLVPEGRRVFATMSVRENLDMGEHARHDRRAAASDREFVLRLFPRLRERYSQIAGTLSGGEQGMLAIGRAIMAGPRLLLLDEPSLGIAPMLAKELLERVRELNRSRGMSVLLVEQNARLALAHSDRGYVMETGRVGLTGVSSELISDLKVSELYLGGR